MILWMDADVCIFESTNPGAADDPYLAAAAGYRRFAFLASWGCVKTQASRCLWGEMSDLFELFYCWKSTGSWMHIFSGFLCWVLSLCSAGFVERCASVMMDVSLCFARYMLLFFLSFSSLCGSVSNLCRYNICHVLVGLWSSNSTGEWLSPDGFMYFFFLICFTEQL